MRVGEQTKFHFIAMKLILNFKTRWPNAKVFNFCKLSPSALLVRQEKWLTVWAAFFSNRHKLLLPPFEINFFSQISINFSTKLIVYQHFLNDWNILQLI